MSWEARWTRAVEERALRLEDHVARGATIDALLSALSVRSLTSWTGQLARAGGGSVRDRLARLMTHARARGPETAWRAALARLPVQLERGVASPWPDVPAFVVPFARTAATLLAEGVAPGLLAQVALTAFEEDVARALASWVRGASVDRALSSVLDVDGLHHALDSALERAPLLVRTLLEIVVERAAGAAAATRATCADAEALAELGIGARAPRVERLQLVGDVHGRHGGTLRVALSSGESLAYRPLQVSAERAVREAIAWMEERLDERLVALPRVVDREHYQLRSWMEPREPADVPEAEAYLRAFGQLLAVAGLLGVEDLHADNVIPCGARPVVVDWECAFSPELARTRNLRPFTDADLSRSFSRSLLRTGLLPSISLAVGRGDAMQCGLAAVLRGRLGRALCGPLLTSPNGARLVAEGCNDVLARTAPHTRELHRFVAELLSRGVDTRVLLRPTSVYLEVIAAAAGRAPCTHAVEQAAHHDALLAPPLEGAGGAIEGVVLREVTATSRGHVPWFAVRSTAAPAWVSLDMHACAKMRIDWLTSPEGRATELRAVQMALSLPARARQAVPAAGALDARLRAAAQALAEGCAELIALLPPCDPTAANPYVRDDGEAAVRCMQRSLQEERALEALQRIGALDATPPTFDAALEPFDGLARGALGRALLHHAQSALHDRHVAEATRIIACVLERARAGGFRTATRAIDLSMRSGYPGIVLALIQLANLDRSEIRSSL